MKTPQEVVEQFMPKEIEVLHVYREALENWVSTIQQDAFESGRVKGLLEAARQDRAHSSIHNNPDFSDLLKRSASEHECTTTRHKK